MSFDKMSCRLNVRSVVKDNEDKMSLLSCQRMTLTKTVRSNESISTTVRRVSMVFALLLLLAQVSSVSCQMFDPDHQLIDPDDIFDDGDKVSTTSRDNVGHSFSSSPYPHQVRT